MIRLVELDKDVLSIKPNNTKWSDLLKEFVASGSAVSELIYSPDEYSSPKVLRSVAGLAIKRNVYPVKAVIRKDKVYLVRTDM